MGVFKLWKLSFYGILVNTPTFERLTVKPFALSNTLSSFLFFFSFSFHAGFELVYSKFVSLVKSDPMIHTLLPLSLKGVVRDVNGNCVYAMEDEF